VLSFRVSFAAVRKGVAVDVVEASLPFPAFKHVVEGKECFPLAFVVAHFSDSLALGVEVDVVALEKGHGGLTADEVHGLGVVHGEFADDVAAFTIG
jgi:hypothetical protein